MVELKGSLKGIGLSAIVQLIGELKHSGTLELNSGAGRGVLVFVEGRLVAASFDDLSGFAALAACAQNLGDAEFTFVEGETDGERTLDVGPRELHTQLTRLANGETSVAELTSSPELENGNGHAESEIGICPLLGFADDRTRHYSRSTALHRCYAGGAPSLITPQEQRELCLGGRYPSCARYRNGGTEIPAAPKKIAPAAAAPEEPVGDPALSEYLDRWVEPIAPGIQPAHAGLEHAPAHAPADDHAAPHPRLRPRGVPLLVGGTILAVIVVAAGAFLVAGPGLGLGPAPKAASPAAATAPASAPAPTSVLAVAAARATAAPTQAPASTTSAARATVDTVIASKDAPTTVAPTTVAPTTVARPTSAPPAGAGPLRAPAAAGPRSLIDVRFAGVMPKDWLDNPPYAAWSDGAYRLQARQPTRYVAVAAPLSESLADVVVSATFRKTGGPPGGGYGLLVRDQGPAPRDGITQTMRAYVLEAGDLGEFGIWRRDEDHWVDLVPWTRSTAVRVGGSPNDLVVRAIGDQLTFSANGVDLGTVNDAVLASGSVGIFVGGDYNEVALDRFAVQVP